MVYHDDFFIPGIIPWLANSLKQILHKLKSLIYPLLRPQRKHRLIVRVLNFGFLFDFAIWAFVAISIRIYEFLRIYELILFVNSH